MGYGVQLGMGSASPVTEAYEIKSESLAGERQILNTAGMRGSRSEVLERLRQGVMTIGGAIVLEPSPTELRALLPRILGGSEGSEVGYYTYALAETLPSFYVAVHRVGGDLYTYTGCVVDSAVFRSVAGGPLELTLNIEALSEVVSGSFPSLTIDAYPPFMHYDSTLTLNGSAVTALEVQLTIDNMLKKDRFVNSQNRTDLPPTGRKVTLRAVVPYTADTNALYDGGVAGITSDLKWTFGGAGDGAAGKSLHFTLQKVVFPARKSPAVGNKGDEITLLLEGQVYKTGSTAEVSAKVDVTA
jgi:hypothetical protein